MPDPRSERIIERARQLRIQAQTICQDTRRIRAESQKVVRASQDMGDPQAGAKRAGTGQSDAPTRARQ